MLSDLLNSSNYIIINKSAIAAVGLETAAYCTALIEELQNATAQKRIDENGAFEVNRRSISQTLKLPSAKQRACDLQLEELGIITRTLDDDIIKFDTEEYLSLITTSDKQALREAAKIKPRIKEIKKASTDIRRTNYIDSLKQAVVCNNQQLLIALYTWITECINQHPGRKMTPMQVQQFKNRIDEYCNGNLEMALEIVKIAQISGYVNCDWAIASYERQHQSTSTANNQVRVTPQKRTTKFGEELF